MGYNLTSEGFTAYFFFNHPKNFSTQTYEKFYNFFIANSEEISSIILQTNLKYFFNFYDTFLLINDLIAKLENQKYDLVIMSNPIEYPINYEQINKCIKQLIYLFPLLNSCIEIALGNKPNIGADILKLIDKIPNIQTTYFKNSDNNQIDSIVIEEEQLFEIMLKTETKIKIQAGVRWQVFKRDNWRCLSCGRRAEENIILHIDLILPRSKGGKDELENYQTLCETCNIGKSNNDDTDLRTKLPIYS